MFKFKILFFITTTLCGLLFHYLNAKYTSNVIKEKNSKIIEKQEIKTKNYITNSIASYLIPSFPSIPSVEVKDLVPSLNTENKINDSGVNLMPNLGIRNVDITTPVELNSNGSSIPSLPSAFENANDLKLPVEQNKDQLLDIVNYYQNVLKDIQKEVPVTLPSI